MLSRLFRTARAWPLWPKAYNTYSVSFDRYFEDYNSGFGLFLLADNAGDGILKTIRGSAVYSYKMYINSELQMKFGVEASFTQTRLDWDQLVFFDQLDPGSTTPGGSLLPTEEVRPNDLNKNYIDFSTGILLFSPKYYAGISLKHLNTFSCGWPVDWPKTLKRLKSFI